ncbi:MAG: HNH endonuclease [Alphaproteobacteria bacterium]|nr:HNH endonuclease [Alphaproteobacteria bacterium]
MQRRKNSGGYLMVRESPAQPWELEHRRVWSLEHRMAIPEDYEVHHIDKNKVNNKTSNLVLTLAAVHRRIHGEFPDACFICGHDNHWADNCYSTTLFDGSRLPKLLRDIQAAW